VRKCEVEMCKRKELNRALVESKLAKSTLSFSKLAESEVREWLQ